MQAGMYLALGRNVLHAHVHVVHVHVHAPCTMCTCITADPHHTARAPASAHHASQETLEAAEAAGSTACLRLCNACLGSLKSELKTGGAKALYEETLKFTREHQGGERTGPLQLDCFEEFPVPQVHICMSMHGHRQLCTRARASS